MRDIEIDDRAGSVEQVTAETVLREWARREIEDEDVDADVESCSTDELFELLGDPQRLAESFLREEDLDWYRLRFTEQELRNLMVVKGPEDEGWRAVADENDIESVAERLAAVDDVESLHENVPKDVLDVREMSEEFRSGEEAGVFIAVQESVDEPAYLADGNHRAVAIVHHALTGGEYEGQSAYVGIPPGEDAASLEPHRDEAHPELEQ
ncbi:hypothetical protein ACFPYI_01055 [Halomarina salina]|uniref:ParB/Sulfiredoxin domain-containing protein n=1 Tax=Halomarina salina TaxID=1872699 RepID=A0ABD5RHS8_9EURY|nr:hypothetical protein [Halomarina salina]